jgi:excinuclease UvrABC nuclease subunit
MENLNLFKFYPDEWYTPNTYNRNYSSVPKSGGVYLIVSHIYHFGLIPSGEYEILYVGSSKNLYNRYSSHNLLRELKEKYIYIHFYFYECDNHYEIEKKLIKRIKPKYNVHHKNG